jgi:PKD repeat protein
MEQDYLSPLRKYGLTLLLWVGSLMVAWAQAPTAGFSASVLQGCAPLSVDFVNTSTGAVSYAWNFGNGNFSTLVNPQNVFVNAGTYTITLTATSANGQTDTETLQIEALPGPTVSFTAAQLSGCEEQTAFTFNSTSVGASTLFWDFGDGTSAYGATPSKTYLDPGTYTVSVLATNAIGCQSVYTLPTDITVFGLPTAAFTATQTSVCAPSDAFTFQNTSSGAVSYLWDFGDGTTSTLAQPTKSYAAAGVYTISLTVTNASGCTHSLTRTAYLTVNTPVNPVITASVQSGCEPLAVSFSNNITNAQSYSWNLGNGQTSANASVNGNYASDGNYLANLQVTMANGCSYAATAQAIQVNPLPDVQFNLQNISGCAPLTITTDNNSTGAASYMWSFGTGVNVNGFEPSFTYANPGWYFVRLFAFSAQGCTTSVLHPQPVNVVSPVASFTASDTLGCPPLQVSFNSTATNATSVHWIFGNGQTSNLPNPVITFNQLGVYDVTLVATGAGGCSDTLHLDDYINVSFQQANYTPPPAITGCAPFGTSFSINPAPGATYTWDFGDGTTAIGPSVAHSFPESGTYTVSLIVDNGTPCDVLYPVYQVVHVEGGTPYFEVSIDPCPPNAVTFTDTSSVNTVSWAWDFGDGTSSTEASPVHIYPNTNVHHVSLNTASQAGCVGSFIAFNAVNFADAFANFYTTYIQGPYPLDISFFPTNPNATGWLWDFGDGTTSTAQFPVHTYQSEPVNPVTLTITTDNCQISTEGPATQEENAADVNEGEEAQGGTDPNESALLLEPLRGCAPLTVNFYPQDSSHTVTQWFFGDGSTSTQQRPQHTYLNYGEFSVYYTASTPYGPDTFMYEQSILIGGGIPQMNLDYLGDCASMNLDLSLNDPDLYATIQWTFSDSIVEIGTPVNHAFSSSNGAYYVILNTIDTLGCTSSLFRSIQITPTLPVISFPASVCNTAVTFQNSLANAPGYSYEWDFGDGTTSTTPSPVHTYAVEGIYNINLTVHAPGGCVTSIPMNHPVIVAKPVPSFTLNGPHEGCSPLSTQFVNTTPNTTNITWFFGDGTWALGGWNGSSYSLPVNKTFTIPATYDLYLRVTSSLVSNCVIQQHFDSVIVVHDATANFQFMQSGICLPVTAQFTDLSPNAVSWNWDFGNGITSTDQHPQITFTSEPADSIQLTITNIYGCTDSITLAGLEMLDPHITATYTGNCPPLPVQFSSQTTGIIDWQWDFGDGTAGSGAAPLHVYMADGNYAATLIVTTQENCRDTTTMLVPIDVDGPDALFYSPTPANCAPSVVEFFDQSAEAVAWLWDFGDGSQSTVQNPVKLYDNPGVYTISLVVTAATGCQDTLILVNYVTVLGPATSFSVQMASTCVGAPVSFTDLSNGAVEWEWNFGEGTTSNVQHPTFVYDTPGNYTITLFSRDTLGCSAFYTIPAPVSINPYPVAGFTADLMGHCAPLQVNFSNTSQGATSYAWDFGGMGTSSSANPSFSFGTPGNYNVTLIATTGFGCSDTTSMHGFEAYQIPVAGFTLNQTEGCTPLSVSFNNNSYQTENPQFLWNFSNGQTSTEVNPTTVYFNPGFYNVSLQVTNANGCADTLILPSIVNVFDTLPAPVTPILRVTVNDGSSVWIEWEESVAPDFGAYELYRKTDDGSGWDLIQTITDAHTLSYLDGGRNTFTTVYCYRLATRDRCGYSVETDSLITHCTINITADTRQDNTIDVNWTPYVGKTPSQYRVYRTEEGTPNREDVGTVPGDVTYFHDTTVICPVSFIYDVVAEGLDGLWHIESESDYDACDPIGNLFADQRVDASRSTVVDDEQILTEWNPPSIMGDQVKAYLLFRSTDNMNFSLIATLPPLQTSYMDAQVNVKNVKYYYYIMATNSCSIVPSIGERSDNIVLRVEPQGELHNKLLWTPYLGWGAHGVGFYMIERETEDGNWEVIKSVPGTVTEAVDEN